MSDSKNSFDQYFMNIAMAVSAKSKDRSTKVGCVVVGGNNEIRTTGFNGFPRGVDDHVECRHERPAKYTWTEHAERNAIYNAARSGICVDGCRIYLPWFPCVDCARAIIQSGIIEIICTEPDTGDKKWGDDFIIARQMFVESGVSIRYFNQEVSST